MTLNCPLAREPKAMCVSFHVADIWFLFSLPPREVGSSR